MIIKGGKHYSIHLRVLLSVHVLIESKSAKECLVLHLDIMREDLDSKGPHLVLSVVVLVLSFDHDVELLEQKVIEVLLHGCLVIGFFELSESLCAHAHQGGSLVTGKVHVNRFSEVRDASAEHVRGVEVTVGHVAVLAPVTSLVLDHLLSAVVRFASWVVDPVVILNLRNISIEEEKVLLVNIV